MMDGARRSSSMMMLSPTNTNNFLPPSVTHSPETLDMLEPAMVLSKTQNREHQKIQKLTKMAAAAAASVTSMMAILACSRTNIAFVDAFSAGLSISNNIMTSRSMHFVREMRVRPTRPAFSLSSSFSNPFFSFINSENTNHHGSSSRRYMSNVGGDDRPNQPPGNGGGSNKGGGGPLDDFLDPRKSEEESEDLKRARAQLSDTSLPINFDMDSSESFLDESDEMQAKEIEGGNVKEEVEDAIVGQEQNESDLRDDGGEDEDAVEEIEAESEVQVDSKNNDGNGNEKSGKINLIRSMNSKNTTEEEAAAQELLLKKNPYLQVVSRLSPSDLISKFTSTADPRVQDAVRATILGLIGNLPKMAFETTTITTGERLASLMFQLQMTGYMFKNAEYRLSLSQSLGMDFSMSTNSVGSPAASKYLLKGEEEEEDDDVEPPISTGKIRGKIKISYGKNKDKTAKADDVKKSKKEKEKIDEVKELDIENETKIESKTVDSNNEDEDEDEEETPPPMEVEVDAAAYMSELRNEVSKLRDELTKTRAAKEEAVQKDLLLYIRTLPEQQLRSLTSTLSEDVLIGMKGLVNVVMSGIGEGKIGPNTVTEQSGEAMAQLCMWQLVVGYNLRELEVREEMKTALLNGSLDLGNGNDDNGKNGKDGQDDSDNSIDFDAGGFE